MASIYTDEVRIAHYEVCKKRAKRCEILFGVALWGMMLAAANELFDLIADGVFGGLMQGAPQILAAKIFTSAVTVFGSLACWRRDLRLLLGALLGAGICTAAGIFALLGHFAPLFLLAALIAGIEWKKLSQEEGFPQFEITYQEKVDRQRTEEIRIRSRITAPAHDEIMDELE